MKIKNKLIKKILVNGLTVSLLLNSVPFYSFANNQEFNINNINEANNTEEISPQMLAVLSSLAVGAGITITTVDELYDLGRMFYDYINKSNDLTWSAIQSLISSDIYIEDTVYINFDFLDIIEGFFEYSFSSNSPIVGYYGSVLPMYNSSADLNSSSMYFKVPALLDSEGGRLYPMVGDEYSFAILRNRSSYIAGIRSESTLFDYLSFDDFDRYGFFVEVSNIAWDKILAYDYLNDSFVYVGLTNCDIFNTISYLDVNEYSWSNIEDKKTNGKISLPIPTDLSELVGQTREDFWNNTDGLINPCTQEIILPEVENPSITIGESVKLNTDVNCYIYNAEELVQKAEQSKDIIDIDNARNEVNKLPESQDKEDLQNRLDAIIPNVTLSTNSATANLDVYIKSENSLVMTLDTSSITFDEFSSVEDIAKENAVTVTIKSSLPYELNSYLVQEITNLDDESKTLDKSILNIKANDTDTYNTFEDIGTTPILLLDNQTPGEVNEHGIDFMLDADIPYENGNYKTVIKFEAKQK